MPQNPDSFFDRLFKALRGEGPMPEGVHVVQARALGHQPGCDEHQIVSVGKMTDEEILRHKKVEALDSEIAALKLRLDAKEAIRFGCLSELQLDIMERLGVSASMKLLGHDGNYHVTMFKGDAKKAGVAYTER